VHANAAMLVGGVRALLLQSLHPVAMQAVEDHSGYRSDPWERFRRIVGVMYATTFGSHGQATDRIDHVRQTHDQVTGVMPHGTPYHASDPGLLMWIHVAEVESILGGQPGVRTGPPEPRRSRSVRRGHGDHWRDPRRGRRTPDS
jgi:uncharacterized protein (DUF2236 family)